MTPQSHQSTWYSGSKWVTAPMTPQSHQSIWYSGLKWATAPTTHQSVVTPVDLVFGFEAGAQVHLGLSSLFARRTRSDPSVDDPQSIGERVETAQPDDHPEDSDVEGVTDSAGALPRPGRYPTRDGRRVGG